MWYLLFVIVWPIYYILKGLLPKNLVAKITCILITIALYLSMFYSLTEMSIYFQIILGAYLLFSGINYLYFVSGNRGIFLNLFCGLQIIHEEIGISYFLFRPLLIGPINLFLWLKGTVRISSVDRIEVEVVSPKENVSVYINI